MMLQNFRFVLALAVLLPCLIEGRSEQNYLNGILFEAPADAPKSDSVGKITFKEKGRSEQNYLNGILFEAPADAPKSDSVGKLTFKEYHDKVVSFLNKLYTRNEAAALWRAAEALAGMTRYGWIVTWVLDKIGFKDSFINLVAGEEKALEELEREAILDKVKMILKSMKRMLGNLFQEVVKETAAETMKIAVKKEKKHWRQRVRKLQQKLARQTTDEN